MLKAVCQAVNVICGRWNLH